MTPTKMYAVFTPAGWDARDEEEMHAPHWNEDLAIDNFPYEWEWAVERGVTVRPVWVSEVAPDGK